MNAHEAELFAARTVPVDTHRGVSMMRAMGSIVTCIRLDSDTIEAADALSEYVSEATGRPPSRSGVLRLAAARGMKIFETEPPEDVPAPWRFADWRTRGRAEFRGETGVRPQVSFWLDVRIVDKAQGLARVLGTDMTAVLRRAIEVGLETLRREAAKEGA